MLVPARARITLTTSTSHSILLLLNSLLLIQTPRAINILPLPPNRPFRLIRLTILHHPYIKWVRLIFIFPVHALDLPEGCAVICTIDADVAAFECYGVFATHG